MEAPKYVSQRQYLQDRKGQADELYVGDFKEQVSQVDPTKPYREHKKGGEQSRAQIDAVKSKFDNKSAMMKTSVLPTGAGRLANRRKTWTATEIRFRGKRRVCDSVPKAQVYLVDRTALFSSFTANGQYHNKSIAYNTANIIKRIEEGAEQEREANLAERKKAR